MLAGDGWRAPPCDTRSASYVVQTSAIGGWVRMFLSGCRPCNLGYARNDHGSVDANKLAARTQSTG
jgi:hypothetical protein